VESFRIFLKEATMTTINGKSRTTLIITSAVMCLLGACAEENMPTPTAEKKPTELEIHDDVRVDDYYWLRERDNPDVIAYLEAENNYVESSLADSAGLRERLFDEMRSRIKEDDSSAPYKHGDYYYYRRFEAGLEYPIYCRRKGSMEAEEQVLLDVNALAGDETYFAVRGFRISPDHTKAAFGVDTVGRRFYTLRFIDLETGEEISDRIEDATANFEWAADSNTLFYTKQHPETLRWQWIYRKDLDSADPDLVYEEADETFSTYVYKSLSGKFIYIASGSTTSSEVRYLPADAPEAAPAVFLYREPDHEYSITDGGDRFFVWSNENADNFQLYEVPLDDTSKDAWSTLVPHRKDVLIQQADAFAGHIVVSGRRDGLPYSEIIDRVSGEKHVLNFGEEAYRANSGDNYEFDSTAFRYDYESLTTPDSVIDYDMLRRERTLVKEQEIPGDFNRNDYQSERLLATARDGTKIPVSLVYRKGTEMDGKSPLLQHGYGSYGYSYPVTFSATRLSLLDRGFIVAVAHIRGGSEMGRHWYLDGRQHNKLNTFTDFIDVSKFLIEQGYTSAEHLYAQGGSAGGLLMGAVVNMAPELYNGVLAAVPFVDVITTMLDPDIPLTTSEYDEWGNPNVKEDYDYMLAYSPYDQVARKAYPNMLVTSGLHDSQVQYWEPTKWVAKLREYRTDDNLLLLKTDMEAGHSGKTGRFQYLEEYALEYGFLLVLEGITE
jgi:oligopeptidase B